MSATILSHLVAKAVGEEPRLRHLQSLIIFREGQVVLERYFRDRRPNDLTNCHSITKSFLSALVGIAIDEGVFAIATTVDSFFPGVSGAKSTLTVEHLLTMTAGLAADGAYDIDEIADTGHSWIVGTLAAPLRARPGESFIYHNGAAHVLAAMLASAVRMPLEEFAETRLFGPLGIEEYRWPRDPQGNVLGYAGLELRPYDLASLGRLFLGDGEINGERVLDEDYVARATRAATPGEPPEGAAYGYLWWVSEYDGRHVYFAAGYGGQYIVVVPYLGIVAVTTADVDVLIPSSLSPSWLLKQVVLPVFACEGS